LLAALSQQCYLFYSTVAIADNSLSCQSGICVWTRLFAKPGSANLISFPIHRAQPDLWIRFHHLFTELTKPTDFAFHVASCKLDPGDGLFATWCFSRAMKVSVLFLHIYTSLRIDFVDVKTFFDIPVSTYVYLIKLLVHIILV